MPSGWSTLSRLARVVLGLTAAAVAALLLFAAAFLWLPAFGAPSHRALHHSLLNEVDGGLLSGDIDRCKRRTAKVWRCQVLDSSSSGSATYSLRMDGRLCWHASKLTPDHYEESTYLDRRAAACVKWHDQLRLFDRLFL